MLLGVKLVKLLNLELIQTAHERIVEESVDRVIGKERAREREREREGEPKALVFVKGDKGY